MTSKIFYFSEDITFELDNNKAVSKWLETVCTQENKELVSLNYIFCSDGYLLKINQEHLNHDYYTDVISFPLSTDVVEGDIFISIDRVKENAAALKVSFDKELHRVMVHGLLHFLGYRDKTEEEQTKMTLKEDSYLDQFNS